MEMAGLPQTENVVAKQIKPTSNLAIRQFYREGEVTQLRSDDIDVDCPMTYMFFVTR
jgi:hypothetical protein